MNCPFCDINKEEPDRVLAEKGNTVVILSNPRLMKGHTLVVPKRHVEKLSQLNEQEKNELMNTIIEFQEKILDSVAEGCDIRRHYRPFLDDAITVSHLHFHLHPRHFADKLWEKSQQYHRRLFEDLSEEEKEEMKDALK
ncbi:MAG: HIT family protein, partial [Candidatus Paceibacterota bacterium]